MRMNLPSDQALMTDLFGSESIPESRKEYLSRHRREERTAMGSFRKNPMIKLHGETKGQKCKNCAHLCIREFSRKYYKCALWKCSGSAVTDIKVNWPACGKFEYEPK
jgi:hypothetical protein